MSLWIKFDIYLKKNYKGEVIKYFITIIVKSMWNLSALSQYLYIRVVFGISEDVIR